MTDESGNLVTDLAFDPFGDRREPDWSRALTSAALDLLLEGESTTQRGFTDHEHLDRTGFIHMNGRVYDPRLGRFVQPDPIVQAPTFSQSYNRYAYVFNDPLSLADPSGFMGVEVVTVVAPRLGGGPGLGPGDFGSPPSGPQSFSEPSLGDINGAIEAVLGDLLADLLAGIEMPATDGGDESDDDSNGGGAADEPGDDSPPEPACPFEDCMTVSAPAPEQSASDGGILSLAFSPVASFDVEPREASAAGLVGAVARILTRAAQRVLKRAPNATIARETNAINQLVAGSRQISSSKRLLQLERSGGLSAATRTFNSLARDIGTRARTVQGRSGPVRIIDLPSGGTASLRGFSSGGRPTIQITRLGESQVKIRF